ncbi:MAG: RNA methyltransferase [Lachnospiraceae bacterium]|nr:RNA methyltransferase [Lachnospiraceae bacterium]
MISSVTNAAVKRIVLLQTRDKTRREEGLFIVEGVRMYMEVPVQRLDSVYVTESFLDHAGQDVRERLADTGYELVSEDVMKKMSDTMTPQGVLCLVRYYDYTVDEILDGGSLYLILDGLQDPGNLGTVFRTAEAAGAAGIIMSRGTVSIYNPKSIRSTMGTLFRMPFIYADDLCEVIADLKERGVRVYAAHLHGAVDYTACDYRGASAFVIGNEGAGVSDAVAGASDSCLYIPMEGEVESLNAAVAASVLMYEAHRQRRSL